MGQEVHPMVPVPEAIRIVIRETARILLQEQTNKEPKILSSSAPWNEIIGRVLDDDVLMSEPGYPPYNASIMDGYAVRTTDEFQRQEEGWTHHVVDKVYAGDEAPPKQQQKSDDNLPAAYYITTGAVVPDTFNCVVPIEECQVSDDKSKIRIFPTATIADQKWIRPIGCDIPAGSVVLPRDHKMDSVALGLLKQSGVESIKVKRKLVVGVLSTGNELILGPKDASQPGKIPDVNRPILLSLFSSYGICEVVDLGNERDDDVDAMAKTVDNALTTCDVIITTGGISMGETDIVEHALVQKCGGKLHFGRMHMKPGKPTTFVTIPKNGQTRIVFAMPGNPVSATVCSQLLVKPCLDLLFTGVNGGGNGVTDEILEKAVDNALLQPEVEAKLEHDVKLDAQRPEYHRVTIHKHPDDTYSAATTGEQRSSRLMSCRDAQGLLVLPTAGPNKPKALAGEIYPVLVVGDFSGVDRVRLNDSVHLATKSKKGKDMKVAVVEVLPSGKEHLSALETACNDAQQALSGSKSGAAVIVSKRTFSGDPKDLYADAIDSNDADVIVVSCVTFDGSFQYHLEIAAVLRGQLKKQADALALQARQGAASQTPAAALFEATVGYAPERQGAMMILLPDNGLVGGLGNVRGLLKHALNVARGKPHNHHHTHASHSHSHAHTH